MKISKKCLARTSVAISLSFATLSSHAESISKGEFVGNIAATSTYLWRGVAQTKNAALQGGIGYNHVSGFRTDGWVSTVDDGTELDLTFRYVNTINTFEYDFGGVFYIFPQSSGDNDEELYLGVQLGAFGAKFSAALDRGEYLEASFTLPLQSWLMNTHLGYNRIKSGTDYVDFNLSFTKRLSDFNVGFLISDTNLSGEDFRLIVSAQRDFEL